MYKKLNRKKSCMICVAIVLLVTLQSAAFLPMAYSSTGDSEGQWGLGFSIQNAAGNVFAPFDTIQLKANVTFDNASIPDVLVTVRIQGPLGNSMNITRVIKTDSSGTATLLFRLPIDAQSQDSLVGNWNAVATIQTTNGTLQQSLNFTTKWDMEITTMTLQNATGQEQTTFHAGETIKVGLTVNNFGQAQTANVSIGLADSAGLPINQTVLQNQQFGQNQSQVQATIKVPQNVTSGQATINAALLSGSFGGVSIPIAKNKTATITIVGAAAPAATPTPSPTPPPFEMSMSLFSWLLIATGFFTFSLLYVFLRRKPSKLGIQMPQLPAASRSPASDASPSALAVASVSPVAAPAVAEAEPTAIQPQSNQTIMEQLAKISRSAQKIQELKRAFDAEREQLAKDLAGLNLSIEDQEKAVKSYFDALKREIEKSQIAISDQDADAELKKPDG
jgi:hypothetical protein